MGRKLRPGSLFGRDMKQGNGMFIYTLIEHLEIGCHMIFDNYPMDHQVCYFEVASGKYDISRVVTIIFFNLVDKILLNLVF